MKIITRLYIDSAVYNLLNMFRFFQNTRMKYFILLAILFAKGHGQQLGLIPPGRPVDRIPGPVGPEPIIDPQPPKSEPPKPA